MSVQVHSYPAPVAYTGSPVVYPAQPGTHQTVIVGAAPQVPVQYHPSSSMLQMGIVQLICGILFFVLNCIALGIHIWHFDWSGIGVGIFVMITGSLCIANGKSPNKCMITACMVMSILASIGVWWVIIRSILAVIDGSNNLVYSDWWWTTATPEAVLGIGVVMLLLGILEFVVAIIAAVAAYKMNRDATPQVPVIHRPAQSTVITTTQVAGQQYYPQQPYPQQPPPQQPYPQQPPPQQPYPQQPPPQPYPQQPPQQSTAYSQGGYVNPSVHSEPPPSYKS